MKKQCKTWLVALLAIVLVSGCSGGGGGGTTDTTGPDGGGTGTTIGGTAVNSLTAGATVKVFAVDSAGNNTGSPLATATTDTNGNWTADLPASAANSVVRVEISGGSYVKESNTTKTITNAETNTALVNLGDAAVSAKKTALAITPLSTLVDGRSQALTAAGTAVSAAITSATDVMKKHIGIASDPLTVDVNLTDSSAVSANLDGTIVGLALGALTKVADNLAIAPGNLTAALSEDFSDGVFDGKKDATTITVSGPSPDLGSAGSRELTAAVEEYLDPAKTPNSAAIEGGLTAAAASTATTALNNGVLTSAATATDTTAPTVSATSPAEGATGLSTIGAITATFSEALKASTVTTSTFYLKDPNGATITGAVSYVGRTATFLPTTPLSPDTVYKAVIEPTNVKDLAGNGMEVFYFWTFTTGSSPGTRDASFGSSGSVLTPIGQGEDVGMSTAIQSDGKLVVAGYSQNVLANNYDFALARYNADGSPDTSFGSSGNGKVTTDIVDNGRNDYAYSVAIQTDGKLVVAGNTQNVSNTKTDFAMARYTTDGSLDTTFGSGGKVTTAVGAGNDGAYAAIIQPDNKIVVAGYSTQGSYSNLAVVRYNSDGTLDATFGLGGMIVTAFDTRNAYGYAAALQSDGKIVVAGGGTVYDSFSGFNLYHCVIVRYNTNGSLDAAFGTGGVVLENDGNNYGFVFSELALQADGKMVIGMPQGGIYRYKTDGSLDTAFGTGGAVSLDLTAGLDIGSVLIQSDGKIVAIGQRVNSRLNANGVLDTTYSGDGNFLVGAGFPKFNSAAIQSDGKIVAAGTSSNGSNNDVAVARFMP